MPGGSLVGRCVLVTAGPTYEDIDPVRYLGNRSTGRMGFAVAVEAIARGARVILVAGPSDLPVPSGAEVTRVRSAEEMRMVVSERVDLADVVVMAAAVADYAPSGETPSEKIGKQDDSLTLSLTRTTDILAELGHRRGEGYRPVLVGFAAETSKLVERALEKLKRKRIDLVVANDITLEGAGFGAETNIATLVSQDDVTEVPRGTKRVLAGVILTRVEALLREPVAHQ